MTVSLVRIPNPDFMTALSSLLRNSFAIIAASMVGALHAQVTYTGSGTDSTDLSDPANWNGTDAPEVSGSDFLIDSGSGILSLPNPANANIDYFLTIDAPVTVTMTGDSSAFVASAGEGFDLKAGSLVTSGSNTLNFGSFFLRSGASFSGDNAFRLTRSDARANLLGGTFTNSGGSADLDILDGAELTMGGDLQATFADLDDFEDASKIIVLSGTGTASFSGVGAGWDGTIDFTGAGFSISIAGYNQAAYEAEYAAGDLTYNGDNTASFGTYFSVTGDTLTGFLVTIPADPSGPSATALNDTEIEFSFTDNASDEADFLLEYRSTGGGSWTELVLAANSGIGAVAVTVGSLAASTEYEFRVTARNAAGNSATTSPVTATTEDPPPPPLAPSNLSATAQSDTVIEVAFTDNASAEADYLVQYRVLGGGVWAEIVLPESVGTGGTVTTVVAGLTASTTYEIQVTARNSAGETTAGPVTEATQAPPPPPAAPSNLVVSSAGSRTLNVSFLDNASSETGFVLALRKSGDAIWTETALESEPGSGGTVMLSIEDLSSSTDYEVRVLARNSGGDSAWSATASATTDPLEHANIVVLLADDFGQDRLGVYGAFDYEEVVLPQGEDAGTWTDAWGRSARPSRTPVIDQLASEGLLFRRCYATGICSPSRALYASGQYSFRNGVLDIDGSGYRNDPKKPSLFAALNSAGYTTGTCGKAEIDYAGDPDENLDGWSYFERDDSDFSVVGPSSIQAGDHGDFFPDYKVAFAIDFIRRNKPSAANNYKPFYFILGFNLPHGPITETPDSLERTNPSAIPVGETSIERTVRLHFDMVEYLDKMCGQVIDELEAQGILDDTLVVFSGDNGSANGYDGASTRTPLWDPNTGTYRDIDGGKADRANNREGTALVPLIIRWPGGLDPSLEGTETHELVDFSDFLPTFAEVAGATLPEPWILDGQSILPLLQGGAYTSRDWVYFQIQNSFCVRSDEYRLNGDGRFFYLNDMPFGMTELNLGSLTTDEQAAYDTLAAVLEDFDVRNGPTYEAHQDLMFNDDVFEWKRTHFSAQLRHWETPTSGDWSDPDGDGVFNIFERLWNWDPNNGTDTMPAISRNGSTFSVDLPALTGAYDSVTVESSENMIQWTEVSPTGSGPYNFTATTGPDGGYFRIIPSRLVQWVEE